MDATHQTDVSPNNVSTAAANALGSLQLADHPHANIRCFTEVAPDATIHFQIIDLGQQLYIWVAVGGAKFQNLYLAIQSRLVGATYTLCSIGWPMFCTGLLTDRCKLCYCCFPF